MNSSLYRWVEENPIGGVLLYLFLAVVGLGIWLWKYVAKKKKDRK